MKKNKRGQLLSIDFLIAVSLLIVALGLFTQYLERTQTRFGEYAEFSTNNAETIAASFAGEGTIDNPQAYCLTYSNDSQTHYDHGGCACVKNTYTARRLVSCNGQPCLMEVKTCG